jgi:hypothetical protein
MVDPGTTCPVGHAVKFSPGWTVTTPSYSIDPESWDYFFENRGVKSQNNGMLRNKP